MREFCFKRLCKLYKVLFFLLDMNRIISSTNVKFRLNVITTSRIIKERYCEEFHKQSDYLICKFLAYLSNKDFRYTDIFKVQYLLRNTFFFRIKNGAYRWKANSCNEKNKGSLYYFQNMSTVYRRHHHDYENYLGHLPTAQVCDPMWCNLQQTLRGGISPGKWIVGLVLPAGHLVIKTDSKSGC